MSEKHIRIGTCGWSYPSGADTWNGAFYPKRGPGRRQPHFDELAYYAEHFDTVEVNSSFYQVPSHNVTRRWVERTPNRFEFSLKLHQKFTHLEMFKKTTGTTDEGASVSAADVNLFHEAIDPIVTAGKLGVLLAQFPPSFKTHTESREYLEWLVPRLSDCPVAVELRHRNWSDDIGSTLTLLNGLWAACVQIDEPKFSFSIEQN